MNQIVNHREMTRQQIVAYRAKRRLPKVPRSRRLHTINEQCNCPNSYAICHLFKHDHL